MNKKIKILPVRIIVWFNFLTLVWFFVGAWNYNVNNYVLVCLVVLSCNLALYMSYRFTLSHNDIFIDDNLTSIKKSNEEHTIFLLKKWTIIAAIFALPDTLYYSRMWQMSFREILNRLMMAFTDSSSNYSFSLGYEDSGSSLERIIVILLVLVYFFKFAVLPLTIIYWSKVKKSQKVLSIYVVLLDIIKWLLKGMNKGVFDLLIVVIASIIISLSIKRIDCLNGINIVDEKKVLKRNLLFVAIFFIATILLFVLNIESRANTTASLPSYYSSSMRLSADSNNIFLRILPQNLHNAYLSLEMYLTNGYQGLSYALELPFKWCFGIGNSQVLLSNLRDIGIDVTNFTYQARIEDMYPWQEYHNWHTIYTWIANDTSFVFLPFVFIFYGWMFAKVWFDSINYKNPYAIMIFCLFFLKFFYSSANNQVNSSAFSFIAWYFSIFMWFCTRKYYLNERRVK